MTQKFRAWWKKGRMMFNVATIDFLEKEVKSRANLMFTFDDIELLQSTGLKDKNGKEIFEGDIVKYKSGWKTFTEEVAYNNNFGGFGVIDTGANVIFTFGELLVHINLSSLEVIGNIYENPELLVEE